MREICFTYCLDEKISMDVLYIGFYVQYKV